MKYEPATTLGLRELISGIADPDASEEDRLKVARQIEHWVRSGILGVAGIAAVGRGKARRYPIEAIYWGRLAKELGERGFSTKKIIEVVENIASFRRQDLERSNRDRVGLAMTGEGPAWFYLERLETRVDSRSRRPREPGGLSIGMALGGHRLAQGPMDLGEGTRGGWWINLTQVFTRN